MSYSQVFICKEGYILCLSDGKAVDSGDLIKWAMTMMEKVKEMGCTRILTDNRDLTLELSPLDVVTVANYLEDIGGAKLGLRLAVLSSPIAVFVSRMMETALVDRSASYRFFQ